MTKLTIGMPVFNDIDFIEESIKSLLAQTFTDFVLIISDDGSTDGSQKICENYAKIDSRIHYIRQEKNLGISKNMKYLLSLAKTPFFMWAADDDYWEKSFIETLILNLEKTPSAISSFCTFVRVDENKNWISEPQNFDYSGTTAFKRLKKLIKSPNDSFGYGIFRTNGIIGVEFPIWWWPNKKNPYNNIYPTLCYYLCKGNFVNHYGQPMFFNRFKEKERINHKEPFTKNKFASTFAYVIRRFNLVLFSLKTINKASNFNTALKIAPEIFYRWFHIPSLNIIKHTLKTLFTR
jgi:glycosyltransferase involved in cell wall biosynthesis